MVSLNDLKTAAAVLLTEEHLSGNGSQATGADNGRGGTPPPARAGIDIPTWVERNLASHGVTIVDRIVRESGVTLYRLSACPWNSAHRHPDSVIGQFPSGGIFFRCLHSSCVEKTWKELRRQFEMQSVPASETVAPVSDALVGQAEALPIIDVNSGQLRDVQGEAIAAIVAAGRRNGPLVYTRGSTLVRIICDSEGVPRIDTLTPDSLRSVLSEVADFVRVGKTGTTDAYPPVELARTLLKKGHWPFPALRGITGIPVIRRDGSILDSPGYDEISGLYYYPSGPVPEIPDSPTQEDARAAAAFVLDGISDFPYCNESSQANALGLLLTVAIREMVDLIPMALVESPVRGTGKTRWAQLASMIAIGKLPGVSCEVGNSEEWRKQILSQLLEGAPVIILDNIQNTLYTPHLSRVLTTSTWSDRPMKETQILTLPCRSIWIATGNNIRLGGDLGRRCFLIRLDARVPQPWLRDTRSFRHPFPSWALENRDALIVALLTMTRAWLRAGAPMWSQPPLGSYESWSQTVGGILEFCGVTGFLENMDDLYTFTDSEPQEWEIFFSTLFEIFHEEPFTVNDLMTCINRVEHADGTDQMYDLREAIPESLGNVRDLGFSTRLGLAIRKRKDQRFELPDRVIQLQEVRRDGHTKRPCWKIVDISSQ